MVVSWQQIWKRGGNEDVEVLDQARRAQVFLSAKINLQCLQLLAPCSICFSKRIPAMAGILKGACTRLSVMFGILIPTAVNSQTGGLLCCAVSVFVMDPNHEQAMPVP